jgi:hypothetical protein
LGLSFYSIFLFHYLLSILKRFMAFALLEHGYIALAAYALGTVWFVIQTDHCSHCGAADLAS